MKKNIKMIVTGGVGVGKTTVIRELINQLENDGLSVKLVEEYAAISPWLSYFYDKKGSQFLPQFDFMNGLATELLADVSDYDVIIYDRFLYDNKLFTEDLNFTEKQLEFFNFYMKEVENEFLKNDNYIVFNINTTLKNVVRNINTRGRESELPVSLDYWNNLLNKYKNLERYYPENYTIVELERTEDIINDASKIYDFIKKIHY